MRKILLAALAAVSIATPVAAVEFVPGGRGTAMFLADVRAAFDEIERCRQERGSWHCRELSDQLVGKIMEKYGIK